MSYSIKDMDTACCIYKKIEKSSMSYLVTVVLTVHLLVFWANPASAYVWRCHSPHGDFWTTAPKESDDCSEYDSIYNPDAAPPMAKQRTSMQFTTPERGTKDKVLFTQQELDQMLAPLALYPDSLLSQILMASTYPLEIVEAARWVKARPTVEGDQAVKATDQYNWEPSVKSLVAFPNVLAIMDEKLDWTERLGDAFLSQESEVMETVQNLRQRASANGTLQSTDQVRINQEGQNISITSPDPQVVYVPYYDPTVIYGSWWWPASPPVFWRPWPGYFVGPPGHRVCVGPRRQGGSRFLLWRLRLAASTGQCGDGQQLLLSQYCHQTLDTRSCPPPSRPLPRGYVASTVWARARLVAGPRGFPRTLSLPGFPRESREFWKSCQRPQQRCRRPSADVRPLRVSRRRTETACLRRRRPRRICVQLRGTRQCQFSPWRGRGLSRRRRPSRQVICDFPFISDNFRSRF